MCVYLAQVNKWGGGGGGEGRGKAGLGGEREGGRRNPCPTFNRVLVAPTLLGPRVPRYLQTRFHLYKTLVSQGIFKPGFISTEPSCPKVSSNHVSSLQDPRVPRNFQTRSFIFIVPSCPTES